MKIILTILFLFIASPAFAFSAGFLQAITQGVACTTYTITSAQSGGDHGSESCTSPICSGQTTTCTITPDTCYSVSVDTDYCDGSWGAPTYTTGAVTQNCIVTATYTASDISDTFTDTNGTDLSAHTPSCGGGAWVAQTTGTYNGNSDANIQSNRAYNGYSNASYQTVYYINNTPTDADYSVKADLYAVTVVTGGSRADAGLVARQSTSADTCYMGRIRGDGLCDLFRNVASSWTQVAVTSAGACATTAGNTYSMELIVSGTGATVSLELKVNGTSKVTYSDTNAARITATGKAGIFLYQGSSTTGPHLDNFQLVN